MSIQATTRIKIGITGKRDIVSAISIRKEIKKNVSCILKKEKAKNFHCIFHNSTSCRQHFETAAKNHFTIQFGKI